MLSLISRLTSGRGQTFIAVLTLLLSTLIVFDGVLKGKQVNNFAYLYAFEPWAKYWTPEVGNYNNVLSDDVDAMSMSFPANEQLRRGEIPFWNWSWQLGMPEFRISSGWFYPLRIFWVIFGIPIGMTLEVLCRFFLGGLFTYLLLNLLGVNRLLSLVCSVGYIYGGNNIGDYMYGFGPPGLSLPMVFYFLERLLRFRRTIDVLFLSLSLIWLNTHIMVHVNAIISIWIAIYAMLRMLSMGLSPQLLRKVSLAFIFAPLLFAFALLPTLDFYLNYFNDSYREGYAAAQLRPGALLSLFFNKFFGEPLLEPQRYVFGTYVNTGIFIGFLCGVLGLAAALWRIIFKPDSVSIIIALIAFAMLLTMYEFSFESAENLLGAFPLIRYIRPFYQKPIFQFCLMLLGALGLDHFWRLTNRNRVQFSLMIVTMLTAQGLGIYYFLFYSHASRHLGLSQRYLQIYATVHFILFAALVLAHPLLRSRYHAVIRKIVGYGAATILVGLTILEGRNASQLWIPYSRTQDFYPSTEVTEFLRRNIGYSRVIALDRAAVPGLLFGQGIPIAAGRSLPRQPYLEMLRLASPALHKDHPTQSLLSLDGTDLDSPVWSLANVNFFIAGSQIDKQSLQRKYGDRLIVHSFSDGTVLERASPSTGYLAKNRLVRASNVEEIKKLVAEGLDLRDTIVVDSASFQDRVADDVLGCEEPTVRDFRLGTNSISALVTNTCPTYFMPSVFLERGWTAYVNGKAHQVYTAYGFLPVIRIESVGENRVEFRYFPAGLKAGSLISVASLIVFTLLLVLDKSLSSKRESRLPAKM